MGRVPQAPPETPSQEGCTLDTNVTFWKSGRGVTNDNYHKSAHGTLEQNPLVTKIPRDLN